MEHWIALAMFVLCAIPIVKGSAVRQCPTNRIALHLCIFLGTAVILYFVRCYFLKDLNPNTRTYVALANYLWFGLGILAAAIYSYSFIPKPIQSRNSEAPVTDKYLPAVALGFLAIILGIISYVLDIIFPGAWGFDALAVIGALGTSLGCTLFAAASVEDANLGNNRAFFGVWRPFFAYIRSKKTQSTS